jgi:hypothetical protein
MTRGFPTTAEEFGLERDEKLVTVLDFLSSRKNLPPEPPEGRLRIGDVLVMANSLGCQESQYRVRSRAEAITCYVADQRIEKAAKLLRETEPFVPDSFNDELQVMTDLAHAAGLAPEVQWFTDNWGVEPSPSVTAPLATR